MTSTIGREATIPNPALERYRVLFGHWTTEGTHPMVPGTTFHGRTSFEWMLGGAFVGTLGDKARAVQLLRQSKELAALRG